MALEERIVLMESVPSRDDSFCVSSRFQKGKGSILKFFMIQVGNEGGLDQLETAEQYRSQVEEFQFSWCSFLFK